MKIWKIAVVAAIGFVAVTAVKGIAGLSLFPKGSLAYNLMHPEEVRLQRALEKERLAKYDYWKAYLDTRDLGIDRVQGILSLLDPMESVLGGPGNYPFFDLSFAQMYPAPYPGLPTIDEWNQILEDALAEANLEQAHSFVQDWSLFGSWPSPY